MKNVVVAVGKAPDWVKLILLFGVAFCAIHPGARQRISTGFARALEGMSEVTPTILSSLAEAATHAHQQSDLARNHLERALKEIKSPVSGSTLPKSAERV